MNSIERVWKEILHDIYKKGHIHYKDDAEIKEIIDVHKYLKNPSFVGSEELEVGFLPKNSSVFLDNVYHGLYDIKGYPIRGEALGEYVNSLHDAELNDFVYTYPNRLQQHFISDNAVHGACVNQFHVVIDRLFNNSGTNRAVGVLYDPEADTFNEDGSYVDDIPCWNWFQFLIRDDVLDLHVQFRSNDIFNAFPSNMMLLTYLGMTITEYMAALGYENLEFGGIYYNCTSAHYYTDVVTDKMIKDILW